MPELAKTLLTGLGETLYMTIGASVLAYLLGLPLGVLIFTSEKGGIRPRRTLHTVLGITVNLLRSVPFIILLIAVMPFTRWIAGTTIGSTATIVPLVIGSAPYVARLTETSLKEVDAGLIEAAQSMGASDRQIVWKVLLPEAIPSLLLGGTIAVTTILGYSAMSGFVGGGGLGDIAIRYGYYRYNTPVMFLTIGILVLIVQIIQETGLSLSRRKDKRNR
ncbi:methionine ABC transporter permease [Anaerolentibacter hominis]|uniref:methionine ABC transporter permease n=1 Tax=Anaerolentibacter hominis TaxID=3079009 RepID=UPI0031B7FF32